MGNKRQRQTTRNKRQPQATQALTSVTPPMAPPPDLIDNYALSSAQAEHTDSTGGLNDVAARLKRAASKPEAFFQPNADVADELTGVLRLLFQIARTSEAQRKPFGPLDELYVDGLDCESIWAELELRNAPLEKYTRRTLARLLESEDISLAADIESDDDASEHEQSNGEREGSDELEGDDAEKLIEEQSAEEGQEEDDDEEEDEENGRRGAKDSPPMNRDEDRFFDPDDMEKFADEGALDDDLDDGLLDDMYGGSRAGGSGSSDEAEREEKGLPEHFEDDDDDDDDDDSDEEQDADVEGMPQGKEKMMGGGIKHSDFFGEERSKRRKGAKHKTSSKPKSIHFEQGNDNDDDGEALSDEEEGQHGEGGGKSGEESDQESQDEQDLTPHAAHSKRMKGTISEQERELIAEKPWALRGEVHSTDRPENSLLEATVDVDRATRVAPLPTPERAMTLVDMIKKRCIDASWDDVTPRSIPGPPVRKVLPELSQDKSKEGLGDLYEKEFLKQTMGVEEDDPQANLKTELKQLFTKLCGKLDALCNFHYTPKAVIPEMKVQADVAAIAMEEVLPSSVADAEALAPEEVYAKKRGREAAFLEAGEMDQSDRKRARSSKKAARRKARRQVETEQKLVSKLNPGLGNKYEKDKMLKDIQSAKNVTTMTGEESGGREFSTSAKFFTQLQKTIKAGVKATGHDRAGEDGKNATSSRAAQLRL